MKHPLVASTLSTSPMQINLSEIKQIKSNFNISTNQLELLKFELINVCAFLIHLYKPKSFRQTNATFNMHRLR